ncbi:MAG: alpha-N-acetylgalactosaminidase [Saprospiraceae bacterium]|nr:MAG: alpha-N-acetylgalactosaminidase [Saprospiraceae bacterium]
MPTRRSFLKHVPVLAALLGWPVERISRIDTDELLARIAEGGPHPRDPVIGLRTDPIPRVRTAVIGVGNRGFEHARLVQALSPDKAELVAICDVQEKKVSECADYLASQGNTKVARYTGSAEIWKELCRRDDIDLVIIATPWEDHVPMAVYAMEQGRHVAIEVPAAYTLDGCWQLVHTAEATRRHCIMLENVCYGEEELWLLNMVANGVFGTLTYAECAYIHDLRELLFSKTYYYNMWRIRHHEVRDGNLYPTHGLGPVAQYMGIDRGDRFDFLVSMSSLQAGLAEHAATVEPDNEFFGKTDFAHGDMNNTLIKTALGRSILVQQDVVTARPYSRINMLAGTKAFHTGYPSRLSVKGQGHGFLPKEVYEEYRQRFGHPLWARLQELATKHGGHGGMDFVMLWRLMDCLNRGLPLDMDVYDAAAWSVVTPLSEVSVQLGSVPVRFPDFTAGHWQEPRTLGVLLER